MVPPRRPWTLVNWLFWASMLLYPFFRFVVNMVSSGSSLTLASFVLVFFVGESGLPGPGPGLGLGRVGASWGRGGRGPGRGEHPNRSPESQGWRTALPPPVHAHGEPAPPGMSSWPLQRALVTIASSSPAIKPFPRSQQEATEALCHSEQVRTFLGEVSLGASPWLAATWRWSAQSFSSSLRALTRASFQRTAVSPRPILPWILLLFDGGGSQFPLHRPGVAWLAVCPGAGGGGGDGELCSPGPAGGDGSRLVQQQQQEGSALWRRLGLPAGDGWRHRAPPALEEPTTLSPRPQHP